MNKRELYISMPMGTNFGWGVCGKYLTLELSKFCRVKYISDKLAAEDIGNKNHYKRLSRLWISRESLSACKENQDMVCLSHRIIQAIECETLRPLYLRVRSPRKVGYTFFETSLLRPDDVTWANAYYDVVVAGSTWCKHILLEHGIKNVETIIQGVDGSLFHPERGSRSLFEDKFVVFSGGKLELRKGQDLVIKAFKVLQDRHDDVLLMNSWYNMWDESIMTMRISPYIRFDMPKGNYFHAVNRLVHANGIDPRKVVTLPPKPHSQMPEVYRNTDCGLFPNRCEGGTNLVLMEYMACGKPAIASFSSGHRDVLTENNCIPIRTMSNLTIQNPQGSIIEQWDDPDIDEVIENLEWAYQNRDAIKEIGKEAARSMKTLTWGRAARKFIELIEA